MYKTLTQKKLNKFDTRKKKKIIFYSLMILFPVLHFLVFYVYINLNAILMSFQHFELVQGQGLVAVGFTFDNFIKAWEHLSGFSYRIVNTLIFFAVNLLVDIPLSLFTSYYFYKKRFASSFFKVMLFLPQILSAMVLGVIFRYITTSVYQGVTGAPESLLSNPNTVMLVTLVFNLIMSFGANMLIFSSAMGGINNSYTESAQLDGCGSFRMFVEIVIPLIWPTLSSLLVMALACVFVEQFQVYTIFGATANQYVDNIGYDIFYNSLNSSIQGEGTLLSYPVLSALGIILTIIIAPITLLFRKALDKFGPSAQ